MKTFGVFKIGELLLNGIQRQFKRGKNVVLTDLFGCY